MVLRPVHAFYGEVASDAVNKAETGVEDFEDGPWEKDVRCEICEAKISPRIYISPSFHRIHILHQYTEEIPRKYHGLLNHKETLLEWPTEINGDLKHRNIIMAKASVLGQQVKVNKNQNQ